MLRPIHLFIKINCQDSVLSLFVISIVFELSMIVAYWKFHRCESKRNNCLSYEQVIFMLILLANQVNLHLVFDKYNSDRFGQVQTSVHLLVLNRKDDLFEEIAVFITCTRVIKKFVLKKQKLNYCCSLRLNHRNLERTQLPNFCSNSRTSPCSWDCCHSILTNQLLTAA